MTDQIEHQQLADRPRHALGALNDGRDHGRVALRGEHVAEPASKERRQAIGCGECLFECVGHLSGKLAAVDENDAGDAGWRLNSGLDDGAASHAVTDHDRRRQGQQFDERNHVGAVALDRAFVSRGCGWSVAAEIDGDGTMTRRQMRYLRIPIVVRAGEAMNEHDRGACHRLGRRDE